MPSMVSLKLQLTHQEVRGGQATRDDSPTTFDEVEEQLLQRLWAHGVTGPGASQPR